MNTTIETIHHVLEHDIRSEDSPLLHVKHFNFLRYFQVPNFHLIYTNTKFYEWTHTHTYHTSVLTPTSHGIYVYQCM